MKTFTYLVTMVVLSLLFGANCEDDHGSASVSYDADSFKAGIEDNRHFVMFFAPWCGHCKNLAPTWNELAKIYNKDDDSPVTIAKVDCTEHKALCSEHEVKGFPTLKFFEKGGASVKRYTGKRDLEALKKFIQEELTEGGENEEAEKAAPPAPVAAEEVKKGEPVALTDDNFDATVASGAFFIKFYAPWCGHCKRLAPTWDELAQALEDNDKVTIGKIDCTQSSVICKKYEVRGYPTLLWFQDGEKVEKYQSGRTLDALKDYALNKLEVEREEKKEEAQDQKTEDVKKEEVPKPEEGAVADLNVDNFDDFLSSRLVFVKFFAPWCGHCKRLAPTWEELAKEVAKEKKAAIAKVDCTQHKPLCERYQVKSYPTLKIFQDGELVEDYRGQRSLEDLHKFVKIHLLPKDEL